MISKNNNFFTKLKKIKSEYLIIVCLAVAVIAIFLSTFSQKSTVQTSSVGDYVSMLENKYNLKIIFIYLPTFHIGDFLTRHILSNIEFKAC